MNLGLYVEATDWIRMFGYHVKNTEWVGGTALGGAVLGRRVLASLSAGMVVNG